MRCHRLFALGLSAAQALHAFNNIHESSYTLLPRGNFASPATFQTAAIFRSNEQNTVAIPVSLGFRATSDLELGAGLKSFWGHRDDNLPYLVFGAKYLIPNQTSLQADLLIGIQGGAGDGLALGFHHRFGYSSRFYSRLVGKLGFMDALVDDHALMAYELGFYPTLVLMNPLSLEFGLIASSQSTNFNGHFALDFQPALDVHISRESVVETAVALGLAGDRREDLRIKVTLIYGF